MGASSGDRGAWQPEPGVPRSWRAEGLVPQARSCPNARDTDRRVRPPAPPCLRPRSGGAPRRGAPPGRTCRRRSSAPG